MSSVHLTAERTRYHTLDGLRGVAALFVAAYHFGSRDNIASFPGYLAVDLFFVLSGFVIALNYCERFRHGMTVRRFAELRLIRLFPMYALGLFLGMLKQAVGLLTHDPRAITVPGFICSAIAGAAMLPSPCTQKLFPLNPPSWSLFFEVAVNLLFAAWIWKASSRALFVLVLASLGLLAVTVGPPLHFNAGWSWPTAHIALLRATFSFPVGVLIYRYFARSSHVTWAAFVPVIALSLLLWCSPSPGMISAEEFLAVAMAFPIIVMLGIRLEAPRHVARIFSLLGDLSYPVYALHYPLVPMFLFAVSRFGISRPIQLILFLAALVPVGYAAALLDARIRRSVSAMLPSQACR